MNTKTTKFLAVLAVLAMAFAAFAVVMPEADAAETDFTDTGRTFTIPVSSSATQTVKIYALSTTTATKTTGGFAFSGYMVNSSPNFGLADYFGYAEVGLFFGDLNTALSGGSLSITQESSLAAIAGEHMNDNQTYNETAGTYTSFYNTSATFLSSGTWTSESDSNLGIMVPQDGSKVTLTIETYDGELDTTTAHEYECTGKLIGTTTIVLDFSNTYTDIILDSTASANDGLSSNNKWSYAYESNAGTLTLNGIDSQVSFRAGSDLTSGLNVVLTAGTTNKLTGYASAENYGVIDNHYGLMTIMTGEKDTASYLNLEQKNSVGFGIRAQDGLTIGQASSTATEETNAYTFVTSEGGSQAIWAETKGYSFINSDVEVSAGEKGIHLYTSGTFASTNYNYIEAEIDGSMNVNELGDDDLFGIKLKGTSTFGTLSEFTTIVTDGLRVVADSAPANATVYILGDYVQNPIANLTAIVSGLYMDGYDDALSVTKVANAGDSTETAINFVGDVDYYTPAAVTTVTDQDGDVEVQISATTSGAIQTALTTTYAEVEAVVVNVSAAIPDLDITTAGEQAVQLRTTGDATLTGKIKVVGSTATSNNTVKLSAVSGDIAFSYGSIVMTIIEWDGGSIILANNDVLKITGDTPVISGDVTITGPDGEGESATVISDEDQTLVIDGILTLTGNVKMNNDGAITGDGTIYVDEDAQFYSSKAVSVGFDGDGTILVDDATETIRLNGNYNSKNSYTATQKVVVDGNLNIAPNSYIVINGGLEVQEGVTITIQDGGYLLVQSVTAYAEIYGTIKSASVGGFVVAASVDGDVNISGSIIAAKATNDNEITVSILGVATLTGTMTVNSKAAAEFDELIIADEGVLTVNGQIKGEFYNGNLVTFNGEVYASGTATIYANGTGATVQVNAVKAGTLVVSDEGMYLGKYEGTKYYVTSENVISFRNISDVTVIEGITFYLDDDDLPVYTNYSYISGDATVADSKVAGTYAPVMTVMDGVATVSTAFGINYALVGIDENAGMTVTGTVQVDNPTAAYDVGLYVDADGSLYVSGFLRSATEAIEEDDGITAVMYTEKVDSTTYYCYTNLADAIASGAKDLTVLGDLYITKNTTIPAGIDIDATGKDVYVGDDDNIDVVLLIEDKGSLTAKTVTVDGTMVIENADSGIVCSTIYSDVSNIGDPDAIYTNIYTALATAEEGDVVKITSKTGTVTISRNVTIPEGVTLLIPTNKTLEIEDSYTLTVAGTLQNKGTIDAETAFAEEADDETSAIAVTGLIESMTELDFATYQIPGAYYEYKALYEITSVANSGVAILIANDKVMNIYGTELAIGSVAYAGTELEPATVNFHCSVVSGDVSLSNAKLKLDAAAAGVGYYNMTVSGENGSVVLAYAQATVAATVAAETEDDVEYIGITAGTFAAATNEAEGQFPYVNANSQKMTFDGLFYIANATIFKPTIKGALEFTDNVAINGKTTVSGSMIIDNDVAVTAASDVTVTGSIAAMPATSTEAKGTLAITGTLYIGGSSSVFTTKTVTVSADAYVSGDVSATLSYYIFPGATVEGDIEDYIDEIIKADHYTDFYVEDALFVSVYDKVANTTPIATYVSATQQTYNLVPKALEDCEFVVWQYISSGEYVTIKGTDGAPAYVGGSYNEVYALINYYIYDIEVYTDAGIKAVSIDGVEMFNETNNKFTSLSNLAAGTHTVTYTIKAGYQEDKNGVNLYTSDGIILQNYKFVVSGDAGTTKLLLNGTELIPEPEPTPAPEKESEWNVTTILLLVLVILIAIMAVIVALRLNRS